MSEFISAPTRVNRYAKEISAFVQILKKYGHDGPISQVLDLGCGNGHEVIALQDHLNCQAVGIDTNAHFDSSTRHTVQLQHYDGRRIPYMPESFDGIYSYHVLEHAQEPDGVITEMNRVLRPGGFGYVGVPNKKRLLGYLTMEGKSLARRIGQNLNDWWMRLTGRFENAAGAHAGFHARELMSKMSDFTRLYNVTRDYYQIKWRQRPWLIRFITALNLDEYLFPSVYILAIK